MGSLDEPGARKRPRGPRLVGQNQPSRSNPHSDDAVKTTQHIDSWFPTSLNKCRGVRPLSQALGGSTPPRGPSCGVAVHLNDAPIVKAVRGELAPVDGAAVERHDAGLDVVSEARPMSKAYRRTMGASMARAKPGFEALWTPLERSRPGEVLSEVGGDESHAGEGGERAGHALEGSGVWIPPARTRAPV